MNEDRLEWLRYYLDNYNATLGVTLPRMLRHQQAADELRKMVLNVLLILNGGGLAAIPALRALLGPEKVSDNSLTWSGAIFFTGLVCAVIALAGR